MTYQLLIGDVLEQLRTLPDESVHCVVTSPPYYGLRDYGVAGQIGLEPTPAEFIGKLTDVFREVRRVLRSDGTCWVNMGDSYAGSWGAQSRGNPAPGAFLRKDVSELSARQVNAHPKWESGTGSLKNRPGLKAKDLMGMPWRLAFALQEDGWWLRQDIIWAKPNPMPESVTDRCTKAHEYLFLLTKSARYFYDADAVKVPYSVKTTPLSFATFDGDRRQDYQTPPSYKGSRFDRGKTAGHQLDRSSAAERMESAAGANKRSVWEIATEPYAEAHFATFPTKLVEPCILAGCPVGGTVLDPFSGSGTTGVVALRHGREYIGIELNPEYAEMSRRRLNRYWDTPIPKQQDDHGPLFVEFA